MPRPPKPISLVEGEFTKEEQEKRKQAEEKLKGKSDKLTKAPSWLSKNAKKEYKKIIEEIKDLDICMNVDIDTIGMIATCLATIKECEKTLQEEGYFIKGKNSRGYDMTVEHPCIKVQLKYMDMLKKYMSEVPIFSPSGRAKLSLMNIQAQQEEQDPILKIINGGKDK